MTAIVSAAVTLERVGKRYHRQVAVADVTAAFCRGESIALVGHNGAGKTTLFKLMLGLIRPTTGTVRVLGDDPVASAAVRSRHGLGFLPEVIAFNPNLTGTEAITFYARLKRVAPVEGASLLERVGLGPAAGRRIGTWSKGMRQRLGLAQALLGQPRVLLLDEPTTGLDPALRQAFYRILAEQSAAGTTVILSSHALSEIEDRTDRVAIMAGHRLVALDSLPALRAAAGLPVKIRVTAPGALAAVAARLDGAATACRTVDGTTLELACLEPAKMDLVRRLGQLGPAVVDLEILPPTLDQVYLHYSSAAARNPAEAAACTQP